MKTTVTAGLAELQDALATLVTSDDDAAIPEVLGDLPVVDVRRYARGLRQKRGAELAATLPLATRVIGDLGTRYDVWLRDHPPAARDTLLSPGTAEALRALPALADALAGDPGQAEYAADLLAFETLAACSRADGLARALRTRFPIHALVAELRTGLIPIDPPLEAYEYRFERGGPRHRRLP
jgi:hypothetical protein